MKKHCRRILSLKKIIPSLTQLKIVDVVDILDEATNYIHRLEEKLLEKMMKTCGLRKKERGGGKKFAMNILQSILQKQIQKKQMQR